MTIDKSTNMFEGELAALQRSREMESLNASPVPAVLSNIADVISQFGVPGAGLFAKALKCGQTPIEKVVEQVESGAYAEIARVWRHIAGQDAQLKELGTRLKSQEAQSAYVAAVLHGLRTSDPKKHFRLGGLTINCVYTNDLAPEGLDDMMRAAVELKGFDLQVLNTVLYQQQNTTTQSLSTVDGIINKPTEVWRPLNQSGFFTTENHMEILTSLERLKSVGFCADVQTMTPSWLPRALVTPLGEIFQKRVREIDA